MRIDSNPYCNMLGLYGEGMRIDQGHLEVGRVHRPPEPLRPHLCLHRFADPRGQELATVPIPTFPGGLPGYFANEIKSSAAEQCQRGQRGLGKEG